MSLKIPDTMRLRASLSDSQQVRLAEIKRRTELWAYDVPLRTEE